MKKKSVKNEILGNSKENSGSASKPSHKAKTNSKKAMTVVNDGVPAVINNVKNTATKTESKPGNNLKNNLKNNLISNLLTSKPKAAIKKHTLYVDITPDKFFVLCDGRKIKNAKELADVLQLINDDMFKYHVTDTKNDFANWINDVFGESELSKKIKTSRNRLDMSIEIYREMFSKLNKK